MEKGRRRASIQKRVVVSILAVGILPGVLVVILTYLSGISALKNSIGSNFQEIARETAEKIGIILERETRDVQALALSPYLKDAILKSRKGPLGLRPPHATRLLKSPRKGQGKGKGNDPGRALSAYLGEYLRLGAGKSGPILVTDSSGNLIASSDGKTGGNLSKEAWWKETVARRNTKAFVSSIFYDKIADAYFISISAPVSKSPGGGAIGVVRLSYNVEEIFNAIKSIKAGKTGHANLVNNEGVLLVCPIFPPRSHKVNETLMRQISSGAGWGIAADDAHGGKDSIVGFAPVSTPARMEPGTFGGKSWYVFVRQLPEETYAPMYSLLWEVSFLILGFIAALSVLGVYASRKIVRPIQALTEGARLVGRGELGHRLAISTGDELEELSETFNQMADNLEKGMRERESHLHQIEESEERYKTLFDHSEDSMLMLDPGGNVVASNLREEEVIGYPKEGIIGRPFSSMLKEGSRPLFDKGLEASLRGEKPTTAEVEVVGGDAAVLTMEMDLTGLKKEGKVSFVQIHLRNITRRKVLEREVMLERKKLETIIESMGDGLDIVDRHFRIQFMNGKFLSQYGKDALGKRCYEVYAGRNAPCDECPVVKGLERIGVLEVNTAAGQTFLITHSPFRNMDGTVSILEIFTDITERKRLESAIRESEELYRTLFDSAKDSMLMLDTTGAVVAANLRVAEVLGYPMEAIRGKAFSTLLGKDAPAFLEPFEKALTGERPPTAEVDVLSRGEGPVTTEMDLIGIRKEGEAAFVLIHLRDIRRRKKLEEQLLRVERFNVLSHFSSTLAHDLRNPILGIRKRLESLYPALGSPGTEKARGVLGDIIYGTDQLLGMVNDVLDVYRMSHDELPLIFSEFAFIDAIEDAVRLLKTEAEERKVSIETAAADRTLTVRADRRRLQRVFINLLDNAVKYSPSGGVIMISFGMTPAENGEMVSFSITDEGPGIPPSETKSIFEPLYRKGERKNGVTGTGLGLYFCKLVIEAHGGRIWAGNREGGGGGGGGGVGGVAFHIVIPKESGYGD